MTDTELIQLAKKYLEFTHSCRECDCGHCGELLFVFAEGIVNKTQQVSNPDLQQVVSLGNAGIANPVDCWSDVVTHGLERAAKNHDTTVGVLKYVLARWLRS